MMKKRICSLFTAVALCFTMFIVPAFAADVTLTASAAYDGAKHVVTVTGTAPLTRDVTAYIYSGTPGAGTFVDLESTEPTNNAYAIAIDVSNAKLFPDGDYYIIVNQYTTNTAPIVVKIANDLADAQTAAIKVVNDAYAAYKAADYTTDNFAALTAVKDQAIKDITAATTVDAVAPIETKAIADMAAVKTILATAKDAAVNDLGTTFSTYKEADYTAADWATLKGINDKAVADVNAATTVDAIAPIVTAAKAGMDAVLTSAEEAALTLQNAKDAALKDLNTAFTAYKAADYSADNYAALKGINDKAITDINAATTVDAVAPIAPKAISDMAAVKTLAQQAAEALQNAQKAAVDAINTAYATYKAADYSAENWAALTAVKDQAIKDINAATTVDAIDPIVTAAKVGMDAVLTSAEEAALTLKNAKDAALKELNTAFTAYKAADYSADNYTALKAINDKAIADINAATTVDAVAPIAPNAITEMAAVKTLAQEAAEALQNAQKTAVDAVNTAYATYKAADYSAENWAALTAVKDQAIKDINATTSIDAIAPIETKAATDVAAIKTLAQQKADKNAAIGSVKITGATVGTLPVCATESAYAPFVNVTLDTTVANIKASDFAAADNGTVKLFTDNAYTNEVSADGFAVAANNFKLYAEVISADGTVTKYLNFNFNVVDATAQYKISAPATFTKVGSKYEATISVDRDKAAKLDDPRLYVVYTAADGITQQYMTIKLDASDTTASYTIAISAGYKSVNAYVVNGDVDWSKGDPIAKSDFVTINVQ